MRYYCTLGSIIERLSNEPTDRVLKVGFGTPYSYRGNYSDLAFAPAENVTIGSMLYNARSALGTTFTGYKGGEFIMKDYTDCFVAEYGQSGGQAIGHLLLDFMLGEGNTK